MGGGGVSLTFCCSMQNTHTTLISCDWVMFWNVFLQDDEATRALSEAMAALSTGRNGRPSSAAQKRAKSQSKQ